MKPGHNHHKEQFQNKGGRYKRTIVCRVFDIFFLCTTTFIVLELVANYLVHFWYKYFTPSLLYGSKVDIAMDKEHTSKIFYWGYLEDCEIYERNTNKIAHHRDHDIIKGDYIEVGENIEYDQVSQPKYLGNQKEAQCNEQNMDPGERANKIWILWNSQCCKHRKFDFL